MSRTTSHPVTDSLRAGLVVSVLSFVIGALTLLGTVAVIAVFIPVYGTVGTYA